MTHPISFAFKFFAQDIYLSPCFCTYPRAWAWVLSRFSSVQLCTTLPTAACQAPLSMGFSRQEYWSGLPFSPPGDLPNPSINLASFPSSALVSRFFTTSATQEAHPRAQILTKGKSKWQIPLEPNDKEFKSKLQFSLGIRDPFICELTCSGSYFSKIL